MQRRNILLGNGVNYNTLSDEKPFLPHLINKRFCSQLKIYEGRYKLQVNDSLNKIDSNDFFSLNIEQFAMKIYTEIINSLEIVVEHIFDNDKDRILKLLKHAALNAIFFNNEEFINIKIDGTLVKSINQYKKIYSLNYFEYWDSDSRVEYLHGSIELDIKKKYIKNSKSHKLIFSPAFDNLTKSYVSSIGAVPGNLVPAKDLYPREEVILYETLAGIDSIDIFGMSPFGDSELIEKLQSIKEINIFYYDKNDKKEWKRLLNNANIIYYKYFFMV